MYVYVETPTGKIITLEVELFDTVEFVKSLIQYKMGYQPEQQKLNYRWKHLVDSLTLFDYGIQIGDTLGLTIDLSGKSQKPKSEVPEKSKVATQSPEQSEPLWRKAGIGLNLEGICINPSCSAYDKEVIVVKGLGVYDFFEDEHKNECPMCKKYVRCTGIMFSRCKYSYSGKSKIYGRPSKELKSSIPIEVPGDWAEFKEKQSSEEHWLKMVIATTSSMLRITVWMITGKLFTLDVESSDSIGDLKRKIQDKKGILVERQILVYTGKGLDDDKTFAHYEIQCEATLHLVLKKAAPGLNVLGICRNIECSFHNKLVVIKKGFGEYDLCQNEHENLCSKCKNWVHCTGIIFSHCKYSYSRIAKIDGLPKKVLKSNDQIEVHGDWVEFREKQSIGKVRLEMVIITEKLN